MIDLNQIVEIKWSTKNKRYYINLGCNFTKIGDNLKIPARLLTKGSETKVKVICDFCGDIFEKSYKEYNYQHNALGDCCKKCQQIKAKKAFKEKYGETNPSYVEDFKEKREKTCLEKYGVKNVFELESFQELGKETMQEKYGVSHALQKEEFLQKSIETLQKHYNVSNPAFSEEIRQKTINTNLQKYGVSSLLEKPEIRNRALGIISKPQIELNNLLIKIYGNSELNKPFHGYWLDSCVSINNINIDVEFDGKYWHQDKAHDDKRDEIINSYGYKILRIKSNKKIPSEEQIINAINELISTNLSIKIIEL